jgi:hypothetical protein
LHQASLDLNSSKAPAPPGAFLCLSKMPRMSASGQFRKSGARNREARLAPGADIVGPAGDVRKVPTGNIGEKREAANSEGLSSSSRSIVRQVSDNDAAGKTIIRAGRYSVDLDGGEPAGPELVVDLVVDDGIDF